MTHYNKSVLLLCSLLGFISCNDKDIFLQEDKTNWEFVTVTINANVADERNAQATEHGSARAIVDTDDLTGSSEIKDLWVVQFNGTADDAILVGKPRYIENYADVASRTLELVASKKENRIVFLANTFNPQLALPQGMTFAEFKMTKKNIGKQPDVFGYDLASVNVSADYPDDADYYLMMCGEKVTAITSGGSISPVMKRNSCRLDISITNSIPDIVTIDSVAIKNVPAVSFYYNLTEILPSQYPDEASFKVVNFDKVDWADGKDAGDASKSFRFYVPANKRGVVANTEPAYKNAIASPYATYLRIFGHYGSGSDESVITYTFYLGENMLDDFNLEPNSAYTYNFNIKAKGDPAVDGRVGDWGVKSFLSDERANCYILNPAPVYGVWRKFRIPIDRIETFWGGHDYEDVPNYTLDPQKGQVDWEASVIWSDFELTAENFRFTKSSGKTYQDYFEVEIPSGVEGNVVIGVNRPGDAILWSWHLWITNYDPYSYKLQPIEGKYIYRVNGGNMHRYDGESWISGEYKDQFMMDRDIGALSDKYNPGTAGHLCYQFGRKDPFPGNAYYLGGTELRKDALIIVTNEETHGDNERYAIANPLKIHSGWTDKKYAVFGDLWFDSITKTGKSIFDPSPIGFRIPSKVAFESFTSISDTYPTTNGAYWNVDNNFRNFPRLQSNKTMYYWPYGNGEEVPSELIGFPGTIIRKSSTGNSDSNNGNLYYYCWTSTYASGSWNGSYALCGLSWYRILSLSGTDNCFPTRCVSYTRIY